MSGSMQRQADESQGGIDFRMALMQRLLVSPSRQVISMEEWQAEMARQNIRKEDLNNLIMDFLVSEECREAADAFQEEANVTISRSHHLEVRDQIVKHLQALEGQKIISIFDEISQNVLKENTDLHANLLMLELYGLISRKVESGNILEFASTSVQPKVRPLPYLEKLFENMLSLLIFEDPDTSPLADVFYQWKTQLSDKCKAALKKAQSISLEPKLLKLLKLMKWMEDKLSEKANFPRMTDIETATLEVQRSTNLVNLTSLLGNH